MTMSGNALYGGSSGAARAFLWKSLTGSESYQNQLIQFSVPNDLVLMRNNYRK